MAARRSLDHDQPRARPLTSIPRAAVTVARLSMYVNAYGIDVPGIPATRRVTMAHRRTRVGVVVPSWQRGGARSRAGVQPRSGPWQPGSRRHRRKGRVISGREVSRREVLRGVAVAAGAVSVAPLWHGGAAQAATDAYQRNVQLVPGGNGVIYAVQADGALLWFQHTGWR